ncbi:organic hydroperoxide resistance protein [Micrococcales bacterium 31B]|nr:organic hydroperoxide resistance protein [Micrococcales bacterium 31B]
MALYSATSTSWGGGRSGRAASEDGKLDLNLSVPAEMGGDGGPGTNPEQLFSVGYAACFHGAMKLLGGKGALNVDDSAVSVTVGFNEDPEGGFKISAHIEASLPNLDREAAEKLLQDTHEFCPYSKATRNNIDVTLAVAAAA